MKKPQNNGDLSPGFITRRERISGDLYRFVSGCGSSKDDRSPEAFVQELQRMTAAARTKGYENLEIAVEYSEGSDDSLPSGRVIMYGERWETDEEFRKRQAWVYEAAERMRKTELQRYEDLKKRFDMGLLDQPHVLVTTPQKDTQA